MFLKMCIKQDWFLQTKAEKAKFASSYYFKLQVNYFVFLLT